MMYESKRYHNILSYTNKRRFMSFVMLLVVIVSALSIFTLNKAYASGLNVCNNIVYSTDINNQDYKDNISNKLKSLGVDNITFTDDEKINTESQKNSCLIVDKEINQKDIEKSMSSLEDTDYNKIIIVPPTQLYSDDSFNRYLNYFSIVNTFKPYGQRFSVIDMSNMYVTDNYNDDGSLNKKGINSRINNVAHHVVDLQSDNYVKPSDLEETVTVSTVAERTDPGGVGTSPDGPTSISEESDNVKHSPQEVANNIKNIAKMKDANQFLAGSRWANLNLPSPAGSSSILDSVSNNMASHFINFALLNVITFVNSVGSDFTAIAFSGSVLNLMTGVADNNFAAFTNNGFTADRQAEGGMFAFASSLFMLTIFVAILKSFNPKKGGSMQDRTIEAGMGILKVTAIFGVILTMSMQSAKNSGRTDYDEAARRFVQAANGDQIAYERDINRPNTWAVGSLGHVMSMTYWLVGLAIDAGTGMVSAVVISPIESLNKSIQNVNNDYDFNYACDRYVDSMHQAFANTMAYDGNQQLGKFMMAMDNVTLSFYQSSYAHAYGNDTSTANNSWCTYAESINNIPANEQAVIARGAGLYKEAIGSGNLFGNSNMYASGAHYSDPNANLLIGLPVGDGLLVQSDGTWTFDKPNSSLSRLEDFFGTGGSGAGVNISSYYRAACVWDPEERYARLSEEWKDVRAMGITGGYNGQPLTGDNMNVTVAAPLGHPSNPYKQGEEGTVEAAFEPIIDSIVNGSNSDGSTNLDAYEEMKAAQADYGNTDGKKHTALLNDVDCIDPAMVAVGWYQARNIYGMNGDNERARRWNYAAAESKTMGELVSSTLSGIVSSILGGNELFSNAAKVVAKSANAAEGFKKTIGDGVQGVVAWIEGDDGGTEVQENEDIQIDEKDERLYNPVFKFGANNDDGIDPVRFESGLSTNDSISRAGNPAAQYWTARNGTAAVSYVNSLLLMTVLIVANGILFAIVIIAAMLLNFLLSLTFILIPLLIIVQLIIMAIKGGRD